MSYFIKTKIREVTKFVKIDENESSVFDFVAEGLFYKKILNVNVLTITNIVFIFCSCKCTWHRSER